MAQQADDQRWNEEQRGETHHERLDRNLVELLQELRVAQTGVQILFAFLLTLPFTQRFRTLQPYQRDLYLATLIFSTAASLLIIAPVAYHRLIFRRHEKGTLVRDSNRLALLGLLCLACAMTCGVFLIVDFLFHATTVIIVVGGVVLLCLGTWLVLPLARRRAPDVDQE